MIVLREINKIDHRISKWIHHKDHIIISSILYPFAAFFHPKLIWIAYLAVYFLSQENVRFTAVYALGTLTCLILTTVIKKIVKRYLYHKIGHDLN